VTALPVVAVHRLSIEIHTERVGDKISISRNTAAAVLIKREKFHHQSPQFGRIVVFTSDMICPVAILLGGKINVLLSLSSNPCLLIGVAQQQPMLIDWCRSPYGL